MKIFVKMGFGIPYAGKRGGALEVKNLIKQLFFKNLWSRSFIGLPELIHIKKFKNGSE